MKAVSLCYHDVVPDGRLDASGFPGASAGSYKVDASAMAAHLEAIAGVRPEGATSARDLASDRHVGVPLLLTFDDGGVSAVSITADLLEQRGWIGHFFITGSRIGTPGFLDGVQIRKLFEHGHVIGSHSWSHPQRISRCDDAILHLEWRRSTARLAEVVGEPVTMASVPGGFYSRRVAAAAAAAGIRVLFTSEPRKRSWQVDGCLVLGRFSVHRRTSAAEAVALASTRTTQAQLGQAGLWTAKKLAKTIGGRTWFAVRERWWERSS
jgi:peptidoglycan/xylan/chitin deacetylase (PgdA/CDA1 family)